MGMSAGRRGGGCRLASWWVLRRMERVSRICGMFRLTRDRPQEAET